MAEYRPTNLLEGVCPCICCMLPVWMPLASIITELLFFRRGNRSLDSESASTCFTFSGDLGLSSSFCGISYIREGDCFLSVPF